MMSTAASLSPRVNTDHHPHHRGGSGVSINSRAEGKMMMKEWLMRRNKVMKSNEEI